MADNEALQEDYEEMTKAWEAQKEANDELQLQLNAYMEEKAADAPLAADPLAGQRTSNTSGLFHVDV